MMPAFRQVLRAVAVDSFFFVKIAEGSAMIGHLFSCGLSTVEVPLFRRLLEECTEKTAECIEDWCLSCFGDFF
jgi:hypothetical protein